MAAINNITGIQGGVTHNIKTGSRAPVDENHVAEKPSPLVAEGNLDIDTLAAELGARLDQLGQGHKVAIRRDEETGGPIVEVRNKEGKVLNQFPPEKVLNLRKVLADLSGMVINRMT